MASPYNFAALTHFERTRALDGQWDYKLPEHPGMVHIHSTIHAGRFRGRGNEPTFGKPPDYFTAVCGQTVKVILSRQVDLGDEDLCQRCVGETLAAQRRTADSDA